MVNACLLSAPPLKPVCRMVTAETSSLTGSLESVQGSVENGGPGQTRTAVLNAFISQLQTCLWAARQSGPVSGLTVSRSPPPLSLFGAEFRFLLCSVPRLERPFRQLDCKGEISVADPSTEGNEFVVAI